MYERIVERTSEGVWVIDRNSMTTYVNQAMADMLGYQRDEMVGLSLFDVLDEEAQRVAAENVERRKQGVSEVHDFQFIRKDGSLLWTEMTSTAMNGPDGAYEGAFALVSDRTVPRRQAQERERLQRVLDQSLNEIFLFRESDLGFEYANHGALQNIGYSMDELRSMTPLDIKPDHTLASFRGLVEPLVTGAVQKLTFETRHQRRDGSIYPVEVHLQLSDGVFAALINDITARRAVEEQLRLAHSRSEALIKHSFDMLFLAKEQGKFDFASPSVEAILGFSPEYFISRPTSELIHPEDYEHAKSMLRDAVDQCLTSVQRLEFRIRHADGSWRLFACNVRNLLDLPEVGALVINARDVTHERRLEEDLQQAQRLDSVGRLAGGVAHDFNNILTAMMGSASFLTESPRLNDEDQRDVAEIHRAAERASELTSQLLAFARRRVIRPVTLSLGEVVDEQRRFLSRVLGEQIALKTHISQNLWRVYIDPAQLEQVIVNLAVNARDSMPEGGILVIEAENVTLDKSFTATHADAEAGPYVLLTVSDTGEGIPKDTLPHVFEPFFTTKVVGAGSGLGLATVHGIIHQIKGHIRIYSEVGVGTTFKVYLPRSEVDVVVVEASPPSVSLGGTERLLVVEDDENVRRMLLRVLEGAGYAVSLAPNPAEALKLARECNGAFDLLVTDVVMPGMSGKQLASMLADEFQLKHVLYISGYTENTIVHRGVVDAGVEFLSKPFSPVTLRLRVRELFDRAK